MQETLVQSLGWEDPLEKGIPTPVFLPGEFHGRRSLAGYIQFMRSERDRHNWATFTFHLVEQLLHLYTLENSSWLDPQKNAVKRVLKNSQEMLVCYMISRIFDGGDHITEVTWEDVLFRNCVLKYLSMTDGFSSLSYDSVNQRVKADMVKCSLGLYIKSIAIFVVLWDVLYLIYLTFFIAQTWGLCEGNCIIESGKLRKRVIEQTRSWGIRRKKSY